MDEYWMIDTSLFEGRFRYFDDESILVRGKAHLGKENYQRRKGDVMPISNPGGERERVHLKPFVLLPDIQLIAALFPEPQGIGEVTTIAELPRKREVEIGQVLAWYYAQDHLLVLWECYLEDFARDCALPDDTNMEQLWLGVERFLRLQYPQAGRLATLGRDPCFDDQQYQGFLGKLGYVQTTGIVYEKALMREIVQ